MKPEIHIIEGKELQDLAKKAIPILKLLPDNTKEALEILSLLKLFFEDTTNTKVYGQIEKWQDKENLKL